MGLLDGISETADLRKLSHKEWCSWPRRSAVSCITNVARTGGHLGPNLGVVELTMAIHLVFDSPRDPIVFDTGHQSYVHKILTGRAGGVSRACDSAVGCPATRVVPNPSTTGWRTPMRPPG
ncbi:1-deoxy-D-xylulose-5-phosphate synthase N-terminal domain-containing protein [Propionibacterium freudenreichii]|uniref:1-deoxy-D-xylulose-5-phosphate synthase N-terminal domain-containing protein n=1 Tax=Propionibacterium freudenreichii TaxID=1744 RepID=UPI003D729E93